jgi:hypothetical protein
MKLRNLSIEFSGALLLIHVLAHFQRTTCSQILCFSSYLLCKPLLIRSTTFICNIDRDWMIYRKHPIRSLLTSMLRKANIRYPSDVYALSFEKYKGNFSKTKMYCYCTRLYYQSISTLQI